MKQQDVIKERKKMYVKIVFDYEPQIKKFI